MQLGLFLQGVNLSHSEFAVHVGATSEAVRLWVKGDRIPTPKFMVAIQVATLGVVEPNDFYDLANSNATPAPAAAE